MLTLTETVAIIAVLVAPLYGITGTILWRVGLTRRATSMVDSTDEDVEANRQRIQNVERSLARVERDVENLREDHKMIHDHITEENHCGSDHCRFCTRDDE